MQKNTLEAFKKAVKEKYEIEKLGIHSSFLLHPSRAKLRNLCFEVLKENSYTPDLLCFRAFLGFEFNPNSFQKLKAATDKFRPIETFFKGETDLTDLESVQMAAILVDFSPRPYLKYAKFESVALPETASIALQTERSNQGLTSQIENGKTLLIKPENPRNTKPILLKNDYVSNPAYWIIPLLAAVLLFYGYQALNTKECMQWNNDHYEVVDCKTEQLGLLTANEKKPINSQLLSLRKINVCDTTTFFKHEKALVWYCKKNKNQLEYFNGPGYHPESGKALKPITKYMIKKYVLKTPK